MNARKHAITALLVPGLIAATFFAAPGDALAGDLRAELLAAGGAVRHVQPRHDDHRSADPVQYRYSYPHRRHDQRGYGYQADHHAHAKAHAYANRAVAQARAAYRLGFYPDHPRWSTNYRDHYHWALNRHPRALEREQYRRAQKLRELRHYAYRYGH